jgi:GT2 family glycosyltransferase
MRRRGRALKRRYGRADHKGFRKVWFSNGDEKTAGLVVAVDQVDGKSISEISRLFPPSEFRKMGKFHKSPVFWTWDEAFNFEK